MDDGPGILKRDESEPWRVVDLVWTAVASLLYDSSQVSGYSGNS